MVCRMLLATAVSSVGRLQGAVLDLARQLRWPAGRSAVYCSTVFSKFKPLCGIFPSRRRNGKDAAPFRAAPSAFQSGGDSQRPSLVLCQIPPLSRRQIAQLQSSLPDPAQPLHRQAALGTHPADLPVLPLMNGHCQHRGSGSFPQHLHPGGADGLPLRSVTAASRAAAPATGPNTET